MFIFLPEGNIMTAFPKMCLVKANESLGIFYKLRKSAILYDKCIEKSIVVCTLYKENHNNLKWYLDQKYCYNYAFYVVNSA